MSPEYLLTGKNIDGPPSEFHELLCGEYRLFVNDPEQISIGRNGARVVILVGNIFHPEPELYSDQAIVDRLATLDFRTGLELLAQCCGMYNLIVREPEGLRLLTDSGGTHSLYYNEERTIFSNRMGLFRHVMPLEAHTGGPEAEYFNGSTFQRVRRSVGRYTYYQNIFELTPNHYLDTATRELIRFYPLAKREKVSTEEAVPLFAEHLIGLMRCIAARHDRIRLALTAGFDSRILFLAALRATDRVDAYITMFREFMDESYMDVVIPQQVTEYLSHPFEVIEETDFPHVEYPSSEAIELDFPLREVYTCLPDPRVAHLFSFGGEVFRNKFGSLRRPSPKLLAFLSAVYTGESFVEKVFKEWFDTNEAYIRSLDYHPSDIFYWEVGLSNFDSKLYQDCELLGINMLRPFTCRKLIEIGLSTPRHFRDQLFSEFHTRVVEYLSDRTVAEIPINPEPRKQVHTVLRKIGLYLPLRDLYHTLRGL